MKCPNSPTSCKAKRVQAGSFLLRCDLCDCLLRSHEDHFEKAGKGCLCYRHELPTPSKESSRAQSTKAYPDSTWIDLPPLASGVPGTVDRLFCGVAARNETAATLLPIGFSLMMTRPPATSRSLRGITETNPPTGTARDGRVPELIPDRPFTQNLRLLVGDNMNLTRALAIGSFFSGPAAVGVLAYPACRTRRSTSGT